MACGLTYERTATSTILVLLVLLEAAQVLEQVSAAPVQPRNDVIAGTEFLSVFINGAMAPVPVAPPSPRRRGYRRGGTLHSTGDNIPAESRQNEASIYRISRAPSSPRPFVTRSGHREESPRFYTMHQRTIDGRNGPSTLSAEIGNSGEIGTSVKQDQHRSHQSSRIVHQNHRGQKISTILNRETMSRPSNVSDHAGTYGNVVIGKNRPNHRNVNQKVIGVSVTSTVEATPYRVRVEHHDIDSKSAVVTRPPISESTLTIAVGGAPRKTASRGSMAITTASTTTTTLTTTSTTYSTTARSTTTTVTPQPAHLVTEELSNIVSESNRSEFSVDEGLPKTSWRNRSPVTASSTIERTSTLSPFSSSPLVPSVSFTGRRHQQRETQVPDSQETSTSLEPVEENYESAEDDFETLELHREPQEIPEQLHQARKAGRHYEATLYNQPSKVYPHQAAKGYEKSPRFYGEPTRGSVYSQPEVNYGEPERVYSEPAKIYGEPAKVYSEPSKIYGEPAKVYGEPERIYGEPAKVYSEPARVYGEPAKVYGEPAKIYSEPSKIYGTDGRPVIHGLHRGEEPEEENYEIDEAVSVGSNGNVHGPQTPTESSPITSPKPQTSSATSQDSSDGRKVGYVVEDRNYRKYRVEERTPDGFIVGEYGVVSHDDGSLRGVRYTADGTIDPRLIYDALMKFLAL